MLMIAQMSPASISRPHKLYPKFIFILPVRSFRIVEPTLDARLPACGPPRAGASFRVPAATILFASPIPPVQPGTQTPMLKAYKARVSKLNLAKRFPIDKVPLKKCADG